jgi:hypothetical protein
MVGAMIASRAIAVHAGHPAATRLSPPARPLYLPTPLPRQPIIRRVASRAQLRVLLPSVIVALKLIAGALAGATITIVLWPDHHRGGGSPHALDQDRPVAAIDANAETVIYPNAQGRTQQATRSVESDASELVLERDIPLNFPRRVQTVRFTPPAAPLAPAPLAALPGTNPLAGKALRYLIGTESAGAGRDNEVTMVSYGTSAPVKHGISLAYCNLFDELNTGRYGPYLHTSDTAAQYHEGQIDPRGPGWEKNLREQFERRRKQGFEYVELDNPDAYSIKDVIGAIELAASYGLKVIAKNPGLLKGATEYVAHPNVYGIIVEKGAGRAADMDALRKRAGKPDLPVWFVSFGSGRSWASSVAGTARQYRNMGVTYSSAGEYGNAIDILPPG